MIDHNENDRVLAPVGDDEDSKSCRNCSCLHCLTDDDRPSNETLLSTAFVTFFVFTIAQTVASFIANSEAMLGDSAAMLVDSFTYAFNLYAERRKGTSTRKKRLQLELIPPLISVTSLVGVTAYILSEALTTLMEDDDGEDDEDDPDATIMAIFSSLNLLLDIFNMACFAKARHFLGFAVSDTGTSLDHLYQHHYHPANHDDDEIGSPRSSGHSKRFLLEHAKERSNLAKTINEDIQKQEQQDFGQLVEVKEENNLEDDSMRNNKEEMNDREFIVPPPTRLSTISNVSKDKENDAQLNNTHAALPDDDELYIGTSDDSANLNMCSAYTHVFADTCRSIAVMIAAIIASVRDDVSSEDADAIAAIVVSILILLSLGPLIRGMIYTWTELQILSNEDDIELVNEELIKLDKNDDIVSSSSVSSSCSNSTSNSDNDTRPNIGPLV